MTRQRDPGPNARRLLHLSGTSDVEITFGRESDGRWAVRASSDRWFRAHIERHLDAELASAALITWLLMADVWVP